jgi:hypothetical protein
MRRRRSIASNAAYCAIRMSHARKDPRSRRPIEPVERPEERVLGDVFRLVGTHHPGGDPQTAPR